MPDYRSAPVDLEHPSFNSLLDALRVVSQGALPPYALMVYHDALLKEWQASEDGLRAQLESDPENDAVRIALASLAVVKGSLDTLPRYVEEPGPERMRDCVFMLLEAQRLTTAVRNMGNQPPTESS